MAFRFSFCVVFFFYLSFFLFSFLSFLSLEVDPDQYVVLCACRIELMSEFSFGRRGTTCSLVLIDISYIITSHFIESKSAGMCCKAGVLDCNHVCD